MIFFFCLDSDDARTARFFQTTTMAEDKGDKMSNGARELTKNDAEKGMNYKVDGKSNTVDLLDSDDDLSSLFTNVLTQIFQRFSHSAQEYYHLESKVEGEAKIDGLKKLVWTEEELDRFTKVVNGGEVMSKESKDEMKEYLDVDEKGNLTVSR